MNVFTSSISLLLQTIFLSENGMLEKLLIGIGIEEFNDSKDLIS